MLSSLRMREHPTAERGPKNAGLTTKKKKKDRSLLFNRLQQLVTLSLNPY